MANNANGRLNVIRFIETKVEDGDRFLGQRVIPIIVEKEYEKKIPNTAELIITSVGRDVVRSGGYVNYIRELELDKEGKDYSQRIKYRWIPFALSALAVLISLAAFIISIVKL